MRQPTRNFSSGTGLNQIQKTIEEDYSLASRFILFIWFSKALWQHGSWISKKEFMTALPETMLKNHGKIKKNRHGSLYYWSTGLFSASISIIFTELRKLTIPEQLEEKHRKMMAHKKIDVYPCFNLVRINFIDQWKKA